MRFVSGWTKAGQWARADRETNRFGIEAPCALRFGTRAVAEPTCHIDQNVSVLAEYAQGLRSCRRSDRMTEQISRDTVFFIPFRRLSAVLPYPVALFRSALMFIQFAAKTIPAPMNTDASNGSP